MSVTIQQQVKCAERELAKRRAVYPRMIESRKLTPVKADEEIAAMAAIVATLTRQQHLSEVSDQMRGASVSFTGALESQNSKAKLTQAKLL